MACSKSQDFHFLKEFNKEKILQCSILSYSAIMPREWERERAVNMLMAEGQLIKCCSHFFYVCWNFGLSSRWLFLQITLFNTFEPQEPLLLVYLWNFWSAAHSQFTRADIYFCGLCAYPRAGPASPYTIPCPMANVTSLGLPLPFPCPLLDI